MATETHDALILVELCQIGDFLKEVSTTGVQHDERVPILLHHAYRVIVSRVVGVDFGGCSYHKRNEYAISPPVQRIEIFSNFGENVAWIPIHIDRSYFMIK
ncbi:hypothetical protein BRC86_11405 [Halobacteriales archaeon QS_3_64_16]|nr:MAG: hypothetical protein BRC86_11405 [Halobacteriales archaeon QS_3_64_16]